MSKVTGAALIGVEGVAVEVEVRISSQLPRVDIVGLAEASVRESSARVRSAITAAGFRFPDHRVTVNLAPAGIRKSGAGLDLPIAVGILAEAGQIEPEKLEKLALFGELALDGRIRPVRGALALTLAARSAGCSHVIAPHANGPEAALAPGISVYQASNLAEVARTLLTGKPLQRAERLMASSKRAMDYANLSDVRGQAEAKRALEIAAAGGHTLLLQGPPGAGKSMLAKRLPGILPPLEFDEALEATQIHGVAKRLGQGAAALIGGRPFRAPHQTTSPAGLFGGGSPPRPGEVSLAHRGVLFLDELPEFQKRVLELLRQVLEDRHVSISRANYACTFPADLQLIAASNPCPCGWYRSGQRDCRCDDGSIAKYQMRISGPLLDRIDLHVFVRPVRWKELDAPASGPTSQEVRVRVEEARALQKTRLAGTPHRCNAELPDRNLDELVMATPEARAMLGRAVGKLHLSARGVRRTLRVARTIADLARESKIVPAAIAEALHYRAESNRYDELE